LGHTWPQLARRGLITAEEARATQRHHRLLQNLRVRLHYAAARREDRLLFDYQESLAHDMGYSATAHRRAGEQLMQAYFARPRRSPSSTPSCCRTSEPRFFR